MSLNSITSILLQRWFWHLITHEGWYAIKQSSQNQTLQVYLFFYDTLMIHFFKRCIINIITDRDFYENTVLLQVV